MDGDFGSVYRENRVRWKESRDMRLLSVDCGIAIRARGVNARERDGDT